MLQHVGYTDGLYCRAGRSQTRVHTLSNGRRTAAVPAAGCRPGTAPPQSLGPRPASCISADSEVSVELRYACERVAVGSMSEPPDETAKARAVHRMHIQELVQKSKARGGARQHADDQVLKEFWTPPTRKRPPELAQNVAVHTVSVVWPTFLASKRHIKWNIRNVHASNKWAEVQGKRLW